MAKVTSDSKEKKSETKKVVQQNVKAPEPVKVAEPVKVVEPVKVPVIVTSQESVKVETSVSSEVESNQVVDNVVLEESNTEILFNKLINQFQDIQVVMKTLHSNLKILQKEVLRERKESKKKESKIKKKSDKKKTPSGFAKPTPISSELSQFLGLPNGEEIARTDVTSKVIAYVKEHNLQNPADKRAIIPDSKLSNLLQPGSAVVTFFNLQTYLKKHFLSPTVVSEPSTVV